MDWVSPFEESQTPLLRRDIWPTLRFFFVYKNMDRSDKKIQQIIESAEQSIAIERVGHVNVAARLIQQQT